VSAGGPALQREVSRYAKRLHEAGWVANHDGNVTVRLSDGERFFATPTAMSKRDIEPHDVLTVDLEGKVLGGRRRLFSEWHLHAACYRARRLDAMAYRLLHPDEGPPRLVEARALYEAIDAESEVPFVAFRRALGRVSCAYREGAGRAPSSSAARPRSTPATEGWCVSA